MVERVAREGRREAAVMIALCLVAQGCGGASTPVDAADAAPDDGPATDVAAEVARDGGAAIDVAAVDAWLRDASAVDLPRGEVATTDVAGGGDASAARDVPAVTDAGGARAIEVTAYYAAWMQPTVPPSTIDFAQLTLLNHFSLVPRADGTLDADENVLTPAHARAAVAAAHAARRRVLVSVGGAGTLSGFRGAWRADRLEAFVGRIVRFVGDHGYDGVDVDVEPLPAEDAPSFRAFVRSLRRAMDLARPGLLLTAAAGDSPEAYTPIQSLFDQINVMTYDLSGPWPGWVTWHNTALRSGGRRFPSTGAELPSVASSIARFTSAGVDAQRLGLGIDAYGYDWRGATGPMQPIAGVTVRTLSYAELMDTLWRSGRARWDDGASVPYLSIDAAGSADDHFVSYDDPRSAAEKVRWARAQGLRSVILWELGGAWRGTQPAGERDLLLRAIGEAASGR